MLTGPDDPNRIDRACVGLAVGLQMHCLLAPWLADAAPWLAGEAAHGVVAVAMLAASVAAVLQGLPIHREPRVLGWAGAGWGCLAAARWQGPGLGEAGEMLLTCVAALLLMVAHQLNRSLAYWQSHDHPLPTNQNHRHPEPKS